MLSSPTQFFEKKEAVKQGDFCVNPFARAFPPRGSAKCASTLCPRSAASVTLALKILIYAK